MAARLFFKGFLGCLCYLLGTAVLHSAEPNWQEQGLPEIRTFSADDYQAHGQNWAFVQDKAGLLYFGNTEGVLQFDGLRWQLIVLPNKSIVRSLALDAVSGRIYVGGVGELGYLAPDASGALQYRSLLAQLPAGRRDFTDVWQTQVTAEGVYFTSYKYLFRLGTDGQWRHWQAAQRFHRSYVVNQQFYLRAEGVGLLTLQQGQLQLVPDGGRFAADPLQALLDVPDTGGFLAVSRTSGFWLYRDQHFVAMKTELDDILQQKLVYQALRLPDGTLALAMLQGGIYLLNAQGQWVGLYNKARGLRDDTVYNLGLDQQQGLWVSGNTGLSRIQLGSPLSRFDARQDLQGNVYTSRRIGERLYVGTSQGLYQLEPGPVAGFRQVTGISGQVWALEQVGAETLIGNYQGIYRLDAKGAQAVHLSDSTTCFLQVAAAQPILLAGQREGVVQLTFVDGQWQVQGKLADVADNVRSMVQTGPADLWFGTVNSGVLQLHYASGQVLQGPATIRRYQLAEGLPGLSDNRVVLLQGELRVLSEAGVYQLSPDTASMVPDPDFATLFADGPRQISRLLPERRGVWLETRDEQLRRSEVGLAVRETSGHYRWQPLTEFGHSRLTGLTLEADGTLWLGANELYRWQAGPDAAPLQGFQLLLRRIEVADGHQRWLPAQGSAPLQLSFAQNQLRFEFAATSYRGDNQYAVLLEGVDQGWSDWSAAAFASYNSLWEGQYRLRVRARDVWGTEQQMEPLTFHIAPPWYRSLMAGLLYLLLLALLINRWYHWRSGRLRRQAQELETLVERRTHQLSEAKTAVEQTLADLQSTQRQLVRAEKMAALGQLVAGVAHEVNTPLGVALTGSSYLQESTAALAATLNTGQLRKQELAQYLASALESSALIERNLHRAADLISNFKQVSVDRSSGEWQQFQLQNFLTEVAQSLKTLWRNRPLQLVVECPADLELQSYPGSLSQVITMLAQNSLLHAFTADEAGQMAVVVRQLDADHCEISFADNGCGIAAEHLDKIFEPFFTTKRAHGGTGLGLHILFNLVTARLGGTVSVESTPGAGCRFILMLPLTAPETKVEAG
ncbi:MAG: ATP-binding protein [Rheinheimera sp.]|nr:ATP-binding protein [Rheinheimera sp.]